MIGSEIKSGASQSASALASASEITSVEPLELSSSVVGGVDVGKLGHIEELRVSGVENIWVLINKLVAQIDQNLEADPSGLVGLVNELEVVLRGEGSLSRPVKSLIKSLKGKVSGLKAGINIDIQKLAVVAGILTDKAQLVTGKPTRRVVIDDSKLSASSRLALYTELEMKRHAGRPRNGVKSNE